MREKSWSPGNLIARALFEHKQGLFEYEHRVVSESIIKSECEISKFSALKLKYNTLEYRYGGKNIFLPDN